MGCDSQKGRGGYSGFGADYVRVQCHVSFQTHEGEMPKKKKKKTLEISKVGAKFQGEEHYVLLRLLTEAEGGSITLTSLHQLALQSVSFSFPATLQL